MSNVLNYQQYVAAYKRQNPNDVVLKPKAVSIQWLILLPFFIGLLAANILSAFHTGPMIAETFGLDDPAMGMFIGFVGVLAVEFTVFVLMFIPFTSNKRETFLRVFVIILAITVSMIANVNATMLHLQAKDGASQIAAGVVGIFAPLANLAMAEVLRIIRERNKQEKEAVEGAYHEQLKAWDEGIRTKYIQYLRRYNITDPTVIMRLSSGENFAIEDVATPKKQKEAVDAPAKSKSTSYPPRIVSLAEALKANGDTELSYKAIQTKYNVGPADVSKVKSYLQHKQ